MSGNNYDTDKEVPLTHPTIVDGWFREISEEEFPGQALELKVEKILYSGDSKYQNVLVFQSSDHGNVLVLDGIIQASERDEFAYQEMITNLGLYSHPNPKKVLVIGGGDGGVLREVVKDESIEKVILVEIDDIVINVSKKYLKHLSSGFNDSKVEIIIGDGFNYILKTIEKFDVIIVDSSDPDGPAEKLFSTKFFQNLKNSLTENGIVITQASENIWLNLKLLGSYKNHCEEVFPIVEYSYACVPTYTSGQLGLMVMAKNPKSNVKIPIRKLSIEEEIKKWKYYNYKLHIASFALPTWSKLYLEKKI